MVDQHVHTCLHTDDCEGGAEEEAGRGEGRVCVPLFSHHMSIEKRGALGAWVFRISVAACRSTSPFTSFPCAIAVSLL